MEWPLNTPSIRLESQDCHLKHYFAISTYEPRLLPQAPVGDSESEQYAKRSNTLSVCGVRLYRILAMISVRFHYIYITNIDSRYVALSTAFMLLLW